MSTESAPGGGPQTQSAQKVPGAPPMSSPHAEKYPGASPGWVGGGQESPQSLSPCKGGPRAESPEKSMEVLPTSSSHKKKPGASRRLVGGAPQVPQVGAPLRRGVPLVHMREHGGASAGGGGVLTISGGTYSVGQGGVCVLRRTKSTSRRQSPMHLPLPVLPYLLLLLSPLMPLPGHLI